MKEGNRKVSPFLSTCGKKFGKTVSIYLPLFRCFCSCVKGIDDWLPALTHNAYQFSQKLLQPSRDWVARGWKPGAISKRILRMLTKAKQKHSPVEDIKPVKKQKKHVEYKPTLSVCKKDGEYRIELQVASQLENVKPTPLVYKIAREDNVDRIKKRERQKRRLIRKAVREAWSDPYHPGVCERTCLKAYKQAIGLMPYTPNDPEYIFSKEKIVDSLDSCSCDNEEIISECSSLDDDWEIHFSPPIAKVS